MLDAVKKAVNFIENNLQGRVTVSEIAEETGYSQFYFSRIFSSITHVTIYDYVMKRKVSEAYQELMKSERRVLNIALKYGFNSHETFLRAFKRQFDITPMEMRNKKLSDSVKYFKRFNDEYLDFLYTLKVERLNNEVKSPYFIGKPIASLQGSDDYLLTFKDNVMFELDYLMKGNIIKESKVLAQHLKTISLILRIYSTEYDLALRFFLEHLNLNEEVKDPFILMRATENYIDFYLS